MIPKFESKTLGLIDIVSDVIQKDDSIFLVGGAIRNLLMGREIKDLDFVIRGNVRPILNRIKRKLNARAFMLDDTRQTGRIIFKPIEGEKITLDFVSMAEHDILKDLLLRDFTVNAMMFDLKDLSTLIDPLNGAKDLSNSVLRCCSLNSMVLDPLRVLRGIRLSLYYDLQIEPDSYVQMADASSRLLNVSTERIRDELFKILQSPDPGKGIRSLDNLGCLKPIIPELANLKEVPAYSPHEHGLWEHTLRTMQDLYEIIEGVVGDEIVEAKKHKNISKIIEVLNKYSKEFNALFSKEYPEGRTRMGLLLFSALYHDIGKPEAIAEDTEKRVHFYGHEVKSMNHVVSRSNALALSNLEVKFISNVVKNHMWIHHIVKENDPVTDRTIHRFFKANGEVGLDICLLSLADLLATYDTSLTNEQLQSELELVDRLLDAWWFRNDPVIEPQDLLNGNDLQEIFDLQPGPVFKEILESLHEAQAVREVETRKDAIEFVRSFLENNRSTN